MGVPRIPTERELLEEFKVGSASQIPAISYSTDRIFQKYGGLRVDNTVGKEVGRLSNIAARVHQGRGEGAGTIAVVRSVAAIVLIVGIIAVGILFPPAPAMGVALLVMGLAYAALAYVNRQWARSGADPLSTLLGSPIFPYMEIRMHLNEEKPEIFAKDRQALMQGVKRIASEVNGKYDHLKAKIQEALCNTHISAEHREYGELALEELERCKAYYSKFQGE